MVRVRILWCEHFLMTQICVKVAVYAFNYMYINVVRGHSKQSRKSCVGTMCKLYYTTSASSLLSLLCMVLAEMRPAQWVTLPTLMLLLIARIKFSDFSDQHHYR